VTAPVELDPSLLPADQVAGDVGVDPEAGLSAAEAEVRLATDGPNELESTPPVPLWRRLLSQLADPLIYLLGAAVVVSLVAWVAEGAEGAPVDAIVIAAIVVANAVIGFIQERRVEEAVAALASLTAVTSSVVRGGELVRVPARELVVGDVLSLAEGDAVGADARVVSAAALQVHEAALTGESMPVGKTAAPLADAVAIGDRQNMVFRGSAVARGVGRAIVTATGMRTEVGRIAELLEQTEPEPSPLQRELAVMSKVLGAVIVVIAAIVVATLAWVNGVHSAQDLETMLLLGVSLAVAAVPEGLPAVLSLVLAIGVRAMARRRAVVKSLPAVETLGSASVVCSDKTGTLTRNEMTLTAVVTPAGELTLTEDGWVCVGGQDEEVTPAAEQVLVAGSLANNAQLASTEGQPAHGDPTELAILVASGSFEDVRRRAEGQRRVAESPFTSERKLMSTVTEDSAGRRVLQVKGAPEALLPRCSLVRRGDGADVLDEGTRLEVLAETDRLSEAAYRTLAMARRELTPAEDPEQAPEEDLELLGVVGLIDPPRPESRRAVAEAQRAGVRVVMITGDHPGTAVRIASDLGIVAPDAPVLTGMELDALDDDGFRDAVSRVSVFARVSPEHKLRIVDALQAHGLVVAMTGDGVNDAPALRAADIGVAMGVTGTEVAKEAATMIIGDDDFATIVAAIRQGRVVFDNIRKFLRYLLASNMGEVTTVFFGVVLAGMLGLTDATGPDGLVVPLLATQILWINLVTDSAPALALGVDPEIDDVMARAPRRPGERILDGAMWHRILVVGATLAVATLLTLDRFLPGGLLPGEDSLATARTAAFTTLVLGQLLFALSARSEERSALHALGSNRWLLGALALGVVLQVAVVELPFLQTAFGTTGLSGAQWVWSTGAAVLVVVVVEVEKLLVGSVRRRARA
jgi:P-type Ca2+ transporter type 2C